MAGLRDWLDIQLRDYQAELRLCLRVTAAALLAFLVAQPLDVPLSGLWAVLTAIVVTQISVGGSLQATTEYVIGTLGGAIYASAVALLIPHATILGLATGLAVTIAPLAFLAVVSPSFRVAPFTAVLVLLVSSQLGEGPITAALYRLLEVAIGGVAAILVSLVVLPERARSLVIEAAAGGLDLLAQALPQLLSGFTRLVDESAVRRIQDRIGSMIIRLQTMAVDAHRERVTYFGSEATDLAPLSRTMLRLRHDFIMIARAATAPLPDIVAGRLGPLLGRIADTGNAYLRQSAAALRARRAPPTLAPVLASLQQYADEMAALRSEGITRGLSSGDVERVFALGFALEQLHRNFLDLERCVRATGRSARRRRKELQRADVEDSLG
jgi:uncharacterized membrane protein YccC